MKLNLGPSPEFEKKTFKATTRSGKPKSSLFAKRSDKVDKPGTKKFWKAFEKVSK